jgi:uncharacterized damage-inducible protein DinB
MTRGNSTEVWLNGPVPNVAPWLQPIAHALLQAKQDVAKYMENFPSDKLWDRPAGLASVAFHLQHMAGVQDRLFTYARGEFLSPEQMSRLASEGKRQDDLTLPLLIEKFEDQVDRSIEQLRQTSELTVLAMRTVGRKQIPSTVLGLLVHAAEHTQRHLGQLLVTSAVLRHGAGTKD